MNKSLTAILFLTVFSANGGDLHCRVAQDFLFLQFSAPITAEVQWNSISVTGSFGKAATNLYAWSAGAKYYFDFLQFKHTPSINLFAGKYSSYEIDLEYPPVITSVNMWGYPEYDVSEEIIDGTLWCIGARLSVDFFFGKKQFFYCAPFLGYCYRFGLPEDKTDYLKQRGIAININENYHPAYLGVSCGFIFLKRH
jgi:hypothetical protein